MKDLLLDLLATEADPGQKLNLAREYLQAWALRSLHESEAFRCLSLVGGTALRFLFQLPRFSEDLDFSLEEVSGYQPERWLSKLKQDYKLAGFDTSISWNDKKTVQTAWVKTRGLLQAAGLTPLADQTLAIKLEIDSHPPSGAVLQSSLINRHALFAVRHHDLSSLMAGKIRALLTRQYTKGRDWYDLVWYLARRPPLEPNPDFLRQALAQQPELFQGQAATAWRAVLLERLQVLDWDAVVRDVSPFLERPDDFRQLTKLLVEQMLAATP